MKRTRVNGWVPLDELVVGDLVLGLDGVALVAGDNLVELVAVRRNTGLGGRFAVVGGSGCAGDVDADVVV